MPQRATLAPEGGVPAYCTGCLVRRAGNYRTVRGHGSTPRASPPGSSPCGLRQAKANSMSAFASGPVESQSPHGSRRSRDFDVVEHDLCVSIGGESDTARREGRVVGLSHLLTIYEERE